MYFDSVQSIGAKMRKDRLLLSSVLTAFVSTTAIAADLPTRKAPSPPPMMEQGFSWTGFYVGANAGAAFDSQTRFDQTTGSSVNNVNSLNAGLRPTSTTLRDTGFTGGGQIGYNYQFGGMGGGYGSGSTGGFVLGLEADAQYTDINSTATLSNTTFLGPLVVPSTTAYTRVNQLSSRLDFLGTVRGRIGLAFDRLLVYGTGGFAYGGVNQQGTFYGPNAPNTPFFQGGRDGLKVGYAWGGGIEYAIPTNSPLAALNFFHASAVTIKAEYIRYDLGSYNLTLNGVNGGAGLGSYTTRVATNGNLARLGLNYKF